MEKLIIILIEIIEYSIFIKIHSYFDFYPYSYFGILYFPKRISSSGVKSKFAIIITAFLKCYSTVFRKQKIEFEQEVSFTYFLLAISLIKKNILL